MTKDEYGRMNCEYCGKEFRGNLVRQKYCPMCTKQSGGGHGTEYAKKRREDNKKYLSSRGKYHRRGASGLTAEEYYEAMHVKTSKRKGNLSAKEKASKLLERIRTSKDK